MKNITIIECKADGRRWESNHRTEDNDEAIIRAVRRHFGRSAFFWQNLGLAGLGYYGQICKPNSMSIGGGSYTITDQVRIDVE